jgi:hypothetical protein
MAALGRILVVDDEEPVRGRPDPVLLDIRVPGIDGVLAKPFDFSYLDRAVAAALVRAGGPPGVVPRRLLMTIAADLGDLAAAERATMEAAVATARRSAPTR